MSDWIEISIPSLRGKEYKYLEECITTNFVSSVGPFVKKFENSQLMILDFWKIKLW